jgi:hypothetical protein
MGARQLSGNEAEEVLKAANLNALSQVFYGGDHGLNLVVKEGASYVPNPSADSAKEILDYLRREQAYGNKCATSERQASRQWMRWGNWCARWRLRT